MGNFFLSWRTVRLVDLPGLYSLQTAAPEQKVVSNFLRQAAPDVILNVVNCGNLGRQLFLTTQLLELGLPVVVALNMADELAAQGITVDEIQLAELLQTPCIKISAIHEQGLSDLLAAVEIAIQLSSTTGDKKQKEPVPIDRAERYAQVGQLVAAVVGQKSSKPNTSYWLDQWFCHPFFGLPIFCLVMLCVFLFSFGPPVTGFDWSCRSCLSADDCPCVRVVPVAHRNRPYASRPVDRRSFLRSHKRTRFLTTIGFFIL